MPKGRKRPIIKAIVFDLDGTLYRSPRYSRAFEDSYLSLVSKKFSISKTEAAEKLAAVKRKERSLTRSLEVLGIPKTALHQKAAHQIDVESLILPDPRLPHLIEYLKSLGLKICLLTNAGRALALRIVKHLGLEPHDFHLFLTGSEVEPKPSLAPYRLASRLLSTKPASILYVGDRLLAEIKPAHEAGLLTAVVSKHDGRPKPYTDFNLTTIYELPVIMAEKPQKTGFVVWITGIPSSGKSTLARTAANRMRQNGYEVEVLETDAIRRLLFKNPVYSEAERRTVYAALIDTASFLSQIGVNVFIAATGYKQAFRDAARLNLPRYLEIYARCPVEVAVKRDSQGLYRRALSGEISGLPALQAAFEEPASPDLVIRTDRLPPEVCVDRILKAIENRFLHHS